MDLLAWGKGKKRMRKIVDWQLIKEGQILPTPGRSTAVEELWSHGLIFLLYEPFI